GDRDRRGRGCAGGGAAGGGPAGSAQRPVRGRGRVRPGLRGPFVRRGARASGAAAPVRPGRGAGRDAAGVPARGLGGEPDAGRHLLSWARQAGFAAIEASASAWCYTGPEDRPWWGTSWAERLTESPFGDRAVEHGLATRQDLARLAEAWRRWAASEDGWLLIPHGEILCEVPA